MIRHSAVALGWCHSRSAPTAAHCTGCSPVIMIESGTGCSPMIMIESGTGCSPMIMIESVLAAVT